MSSDFRRDWVKNKVTKYFGLPSDNYFEEMLENTDDLEDKLAAYLDDDFMYQEENKRFFYVYKTSYEKLIEEEIMVAEKGILSFPFYLCKLFCLRMNINYIL